MKKTKDTFDREAHYRELDKEYKLEMDKRNILISEYERLIKKANDSKPIDIALLGYALSKIRENWPLDFPIKYFYDYMSHEYFLDSTKTKSYIEIYSRFTEFDRENSRPVFKKEFIGYSLEQLMILASVSNYQVDCFDKKMSIRKMRKIKYSLEFFPEFDPTTLPDTEAEENEVLSIIIDPNLKSRIRKKGNLKDNLLEYCENRIKRGAAYISDDKLQGYIEIGAFLCEIKKYQLYNQAANMNVYCLQEFAMKAEFVEKCMLFFEECGKMDTNTYEPTLKNSRYNAFSERSTLDALYHLWRG